MAVLGRRGDTSQACLLAGGRLDPCVTVAFVASGVGISADGRRVYVLQQKPGRLLPFRVTGDGLAAEEPIEVKGAPRGELVAYGKSLYVPVERGLLVVNAESGVSRVVALPTTPSAVWIAASGRAFAPLPAMNAVAVLDTAHISKPARMVKVGKQPFSVEPLRAGTGKPVVKVVNVGDRSLSTLDAATGALVRTRAVPALERVAPKPLVASRVSFRQAKRVVTARLAFAGGALHAGDVVAIERRIADGRASFEIWQGGISTRVKLQRFTVGVLRVRITQLAGHLRVADLRSEGCLQVAAARASRPPDLPPPHTAACRRDAFATTHASDASVATRPDASKRVRVPTPTPPPPPPPTTTLCADPPCIG